MIPSGIFAGDILDQKREAETEPKKLFYFVFSFVCLFVCVCVKNKNKMIKKTKKNSLLIQELAFVCFVQLGPLPCLMSPEMYETKIYLNITKMFC